MTAAPSRGIFITLEGGEGVGKSTQAARLADALRKHNKTVVLTREPGGTPGAEAIRTLLMTGGTERWSARAEALLFAAARADHVERVIRPALERGDWVVCDRFIDSTRAYQGGAGGVSDAEIMGLHTFGSEGLTPDRTLLLTVDAQIAGQRVAARGGQDRFGELPQAYHDRLAIEFARIASDEPERFRQIEAGASPEVVTGRLLAALDDLL